MKSKILKTDPNSNSNLATMTHVAAVGANLIPTVSSSSSTSASEDTELSSELSDFPDASGVKLVSLETPGNVTATTLSQQVSGNDE